jgi:SAM-dependent methyltransferase
MDVGRLARWYRWIEYAAFERALERSRLAFLDKLAGARRVLILGEGDGRTLQRLLALAAEARFDVVESSAEMIALARARIGNTARVRFQCQDALTATFPQAAYDGVVTCFFLDCFTESELRDLLQRVQSALNPGAIWLLSEFAIPARGWQRWYAKIWIWTMYRFFQATTSLRTRRLAPIERLLSEFGMHSVAIRRQRWGMIVSEVLEFQPASVRNSIKRAGHH